MVIDEIHRKRGGVRGQHRLGQVSLQRQRVAAVGDDRQPGPQGAQLRQRREPGQRPGLGPDQVLGGFHRRGAQRERHAGRGQQRHVTRPAAGPGQDRAGLCLVEERVQQHRARIPAGQVAAPSRGPGGNARPAAGPRPAPAAVPATGTGPGGTIWPTPEGSGSSRAIRSSVRPATAPASAAAAAPGAAGSHAASFPPSSVPSSS